jgi:hypothetical protein
MTAWTWSRQLQSALSLIPTHGLGQSKPVWADAVRLREESGWLTVTSGEHTCLHVSRHVSAPKHCNLCGDPRGKGQCAWRVWGRVTVTCPNEGRSCPGHCSSTVKIRRVRLRRQLCSVLTPSTIRDWVHRSSCACRILERVARLVLVVWGALGGRREKGPNEAVEASFGGQAREQRSWTCHG